MVVKRTRAKKFGALLLILALLCLFLVSSSAVYAEENFTNVSLTTVPGVSYADLYKMLDGNNNVYGRITLDNIDLIEFGDLIVVFQFDPVYVGTVNIYTGSTGFAMLWTFSPDPPPGSVSNLRLKDDKGYQYAGTHYDCYVTWNSTGADEYKVYKNGQLVGTTTSNEYVVSVDNVNTKVIEVSPVIGGVEQPKAKMIVSPAMTTGDDESFVVNGVISSIRGHMISQNPYNGADHWIDYISYGPPQPPPSVANLDVINITKNTATVTWGAIDAEKYNIYLNGLLVGTTTNTYYDLTGLTLGTTYTVEVSGVRGTVEGPKTSKTFSTIPPDQVTNLTITEVTKNSATATWTGTPNAEQYRVYLNGILVGTTTDTHYSFTDLSPGTSYTVSVSAVESGVESSKISTTFSTISPDPVTNLDVTNITTTSATATWTGTASASEYKVYLNGQLLGTTTNTTYPLTGLTPDTTYTVEVSPVESGVEGTRTSKTFTTLKLPDLKVYWIVGGNYVRVEWSSNGSQIDADWIQLWRTDTATGIWMPVKDITGSEINSFTWTDTMVTAGLNYKYQIRAYNTSNWSWDVIWESDWAVNPRPFNAPGGLKVTFRGDTTATVTWTTVNGADQYQVQVSTDGGATWQTSTVSGPPVTVPRPCQVRVKAGTHARSQWSGVLTVQ
ncbi:MAG: hypothetical protein IMW94_01980 [Thermoanaerobacter sp.]|nr:hypothetical protein [Thermoanaerobacter sp.]